MRIRVLIADDDEVVRKSLSDLLSREPDIDIVGTAKDGRTAIKLAHRQSPDVALIDVTMPGTNGVRTTFEIAASASGTRVVGISMHDEPEWVKQMVRAGARGYVLKETAAEELATAVRVVCAGETYFSRGVAAPSVSIQKPRASNGRATSRSTN